VQGYLVARPMPGAQVADFLRRHIDTAKAAAAAV